GCASLAGISDPSHNPELELFSRRNGVRQMRYTEFINWLKNQSVRIFLNGPPPITGTVGLIIALAPVTFRRSGTSVRARVESQAALRRVRLRDTHFGEAGDGAIVNRGEVKIS